MMAKAAFGCIECLSMFSKDAVPNNLHTRPLNYANYENEMVKILLLVNIVAIQHIITYL